MNHCGQRSDILATSSGWKTRGGRRETPQLHRVRLGRSACEYSDEELMRIMGIDDPRVTRAQAAMTARRIIEVNPVKSG